MNLVRQRETVTKQQELLKTEGKSVDSVRARMKQQVVESHKKKAADRTKKEFKECQRCLGKHSLKSCPAKESNCRKCGKKGHWQRACRSKMEKSVEEVISGEIVS